MIPFTTAVIFFLLFVLQTSMFKMFGWIAPDVPLLASLYFGSRYMETPGLQAGILCGFLQDIASFGLMGINFLSKGLCGMGAGWLMEKHIIERQATVTWIILIFFGTAINQTILLGYTASFFDSPVYFWSAFWRFLEQMFVNLLMGLPVFSLLERIETRMRKLLGIREV